MPSNLIIHHGALQFNPPYFDELIGSEKNAKGRLPRDVEAHALWYYYLLVSKAYKDFQANLVYDDEKSRRFTAETAHRILENVAKQYNSSPRRLVRYWDAVDAQRRALGFSTNADIPAVFRFRFN